MCFIYFENVTIGGREIQLNVQNNIFSLPDVQMKNENVTK